MDAILNYINFKMFNVLTAKDKELNLDILIKLYDYFCGEFGVDTALRSDLITYLEHNIKFEMYKEIDDEEENDISNKSKREIITTKLNIFKKRGWVEEEYNNDLDIIYMLNSDAITILEALYSLMHVDRSNEFSGYVISTYNNLKNIDYDKNSTQAIEQAFESSKKFSNNLNSMNSNIRRYTNEILQKENYNADDIATNLFKEYQNKVGVKLFNNLKINENPRMYARNIIELVDMFLEDSNFRRIMSNYQEVKKIKKLVNEDFQYMKSRLNFIKATFSNVDSRMRNIDSKNNTYLRVCEDKIKFIINESKDIEQGINDLLKTMGFCRDFSDFEDFFEIDNIENIDQYSIFKARVNSKRTNKVELESKDNIEIDDFKNLVNKIKNDNQYSFEGINNFAKSILKTKEIIKISDLDIKDENLYIKVFLLTAYQNNERASYKIKYLNDETIVNDYVMNNFEIMRSNKL